MSTNHDPFENDLGSLERRALPAAWRNEMLAAAATASAPRRMRTPRWLVAGWGVAWAAILGMWLTTPAEPSPQPQAAQPAPGAPSILWAGRTATIESLLATN